jgi:nucleoside-diphosphate-sugar epimerase
VGSHVLDSLRARGLPTVLLLRSASHRRWLEHHLAEVEVRPGSIGEPGSLREALTGVTDVIHCAGCIKATRISEFFSVNQIGTRNLVEAVNANPRSVRRLVHLSSLAAAGPATADRPAREDCPPNPVSDYGRSKLAAEAEVRDHCRAEFVILRPPAVYGPRDTAFLPMFKAVRRHFLPRPNPRQTLSLVYVKDLAEAVVSGLIHPAAAGKTYFVASRETVTAAGMAREIADQMRRWTIPCPLPTVLLSALCAGGEALGRLTGKARLLSWQKLAEVRAPGWVCDPTLLERELGYRCSTGLKAGIGETLAWYGREGWL